MVEPFSSPSGAHLGTNAKVLMVDDEPYVLSVLHSLFADQYQCQIARSAEEAVDYGKLEVSIADLRKKMNAAAQKMEFEEAAIYRDRLKALERLQIEQGV